MTKGRVAELRKMVKEQRERDEKPLSMTTVVLCAIAICISLMSMAVSFTVMALR